MTLQEKYAAYEKAKEELMQEVNELVGKDVMTKQYGKCNVIEILDMVNHVLVRMPDGNYASVHFADITEVYNNSSNKFEVFSK